MRRARDYDEKARRSWSARGNDKRLADFATSFRREALELLAMERPHEAVQVLAWVPATFEQCLHFTGINLMTLSTLKPVMVALKVLAIALLQTGTAINVDLAEHI